MTESSAFAGWVRLPAAARRFRISGQSQRFLVRAVIAVLAVRIALIVAGYITGYVIIGRENAPAGDLLLETFNRWDAPHYLDIAEGGYTSEGPDRVFIVFFPLYPVAIFLANLFIQSYFVSALVVSAVASVVAGYLMQMLIAKDGGDDGESSRGLWYMSLFPTAFFYAMPYAESLYLALVLGAVVSARNGRWAWSGALGALACATRLQGIVLLPALAVEAFTQERSDATRKAIWLALVPLGLALYLGINLVVFSDLFAFLDIQRDHWHHEAIWPWESFRESFNAVTDFPSGSARTQVHELRLAGIVIGGALLLAGARWLRPSYQVFGWVTLLLLMSVSFQTSMPRYLLGLFPIFLVLARLRYSSSVHQGLLMGSAVLMGLLFVVYATRWGF